MKRIFILILLIPCAAQAQYKGEYFAKKTYTPHPLPEFAQMRDKLPEPIFDENPAWVDTYWKAWEIAFGNFYEPTPANGFVSQYIDAAFNDCIFMWDTCFMTFFCNYAHPLTPGIASLDNFYIKQYPNGEIGREIRRGDGGDCDLWVNHGREELYSAWGYNVSGVFEKTYVEYIGREKPREPSYLTLDNMNHPIMAWAEMVSYGMTGDLDRIGMVYEPLKKQYEAFDNYNRQGNGLYMVDWASMDNSARNKYLKGGGTGIDISCEMVLFARCLARMGELVGAPREEVEYYNVRAEKLSRSINELMWNGGKEFYCDLMPGGESVGIKTVAAYWTLAAGVATPERAAILASHLENPATFGRRNLVPTLSADEESFSELGNYWCGSVWAPTTAMVVDGLEKYGYGELAREVALNHIALVADVYGLTGTIWENYSPDMKLNGFLHDGKPVAKDFVGWTGIGPIKFLLEYGVGLKASARDNTITWTIDSLDRTGCRNFRFNSNVVSLLANESHNPSRITVQAEKPFTLNVVRNGDEYTFNVREGANEFEIN